MNRLLLTIVSLAVLSPALADETRKVIRLSEPVVVTEDSETFGAELTMEDPVYSLGALLGDADAHLDERVLVEARVSKVCQKKGCFFIAQDGNHVVRVSFRDYGFFVPTDIGGRKVLLEGNLVKVELSEEKAEHYEEDLGGDTPVKPGATYEIVADSVRVPKA